MMFDKFKGIEFDEVSHKYFYKGKTAGMSTTGFIHQYANEFDEQIMAERVAKKNCKIIDAYLFDGDEPPILPILIEEVLEEWHFERDYACCKGNIVHRFGQELWGGEKFIYNINDYSQEYHERLKKDVPILFKQAENFYNDYKNLLEFVKDEQYLYDEDYDLAGSIDLLFKNKITGAYVICDFKTNKEIKFKGYGKMLVPLEKHQDCNFIHYSMQVYIYKHIVEKNTGLEMEPPFIVHFDVTKENYTMIEPLNLGLEVEKILNMRRERIMGKCIPILIIGKSGSGKSTSLRNLKKEEYSLVNPLAKRLPFKNDVKGLENNNYEVIKKFIKETPKDIIVIDDSNYLLTIEMMAKAKEAGYGKFTDIAKHYWDLIEFIKKLDGDKRIYLMSHEEIDEFGNIKVKTVGKMLENQCSIEGLYTVVLRATNENGEFNFTTKTNGNDIVKTPMGMFEDKTIENDLKLVDDTICDYYSIEKKEDKKDEEK